MCSSKRERTQSLKDRTVFFYCASKSSRHSRHNQTLTTDDAAHTHTGCDYSAFTGEADALVRPKGAVLTQVPAGHWGHTGPKGVVATMDAIIPDGEIIPFGSPPCPYCGSPHMAWWPSPKNPEPAGWWECPRCDRPMLPSKADPAPDSNTGE